MKSLNVTLMGILVLFVWALLFTSCAKQETILTDSVEEVDNIEWMKLQSSINQSLDC